MDIARSRELSRRCWDLFFFGFSGLGFGFEGFAVWVLRGSGFWVCRAFAV